MKAWKLQIKFRIRVLIERPSWKRVHGLGFTELNHKAGENALNLIRDWEIGGSGGF